MKEITIAGREAGFLNVSEDDSRIAGICFFAISE
jgi:hypothetical protein